MTRSQAVPKEKREASIIDAACSVIREKGLKGARVADIARVAGTSYGLVYHYFANKDELFDAIVAAWWGSVNELLDRCAELASTREQLTAFTTGLLDLYARRPSLTHIFVTEISRSTANLTAERLQAFKQFIDRVEALMREGQARGRLRRDVGPRYLAYGFLGAVETVVSSMVLEDQAVGTPRQQEHIAHSLMVLFVEGAQPASAAAVAGSRGRG